jgi:hypothetical protein
VTAGVDGTIESVLRNEGYGRRRGRDRHPVCGIVPVIPGRRVPLIRSR